MNTNADILSLIPQRKPFVMVDKLLYSGDTITRSAFVIQEDNVLVENGFFKEPGLVENIAQTAAARAGYIALHENKPVRLGYIGAVKNLQVFALPETGDELITEVTMENHIFDVSIISGKIFCNEKILAQCEMKIFISNL